MESASIPTTELAGVARVERDLAGQLGLAPSLVAPAQAGRAWLGKGAAVGDRRGYWLRRLLLAADISALCAAFMLQEQMLGGFRTQHVILLALSIPLWVFVGYTQRLYHLDGHRADYRAAEEAGPVLQMAMIASWSTLILLTLLSVKGLTVLRVSLQWGLAVVLLILGRSLVRAIARRRSWYLQRALVIGPHREVAAIIRRIKRHPEWGIVPTACSDGSGTRRFHRNDPAGALRDAELVELVTELDVDRVMLAPTVTESRDRAELVCALADLGVHVDLVPSWSHAVGSRLDLHEMEGMPVLTVPRARLGGFSFLIKRALDLVVTTFALIVLAPLLAVCAVAIKLDSPGPVLFRQRRVGKGERPFQVFKFRSMFNDAEKRKDEVAVLNLHGGGTETGMFKIREDPRITRVGRVLRRYSLDELPQLFNVLSGQMSLVGPRPLIENEDRQVEGRFRRRLGLTPGLTGLWQAHGRSEIPFEEMVSLDYLYVTNWSLWGDVKLLIRTFGAVIHGGGAY